MESKEVGKKKVLSGEELTKQLDRLLQDKANNQRIIDWVEVTAPLSIFSILSGSFIQNQPLNMIFFFVLSFLG